MLTKDERESAALRLAELLSLSQLMRCFPEGMRLGLRLILGQRYEAADLANALLLLDDVELLRNSELRTLLTRSLDNGTKNPGRWHPGKGDAVRFVEACGLPVALSGLVGDGRRPRIEEVEQYVHLKPLHDWQEDVARRALSLFRDRHYDRRKAILSLPTGAGKTRTTVHALVELLWDTTDENRPVVWIAQSEELCEQAIECIGQVWRYQSVRLAETSRRGQSALRIQRFFGVHRLDEEPAHVVVTSIPKLHRALGLGKGRKDPQIAEDALRLFEDPRAVIIDEAHHAIAPTYRQVIRRFTANSRCPILGLTATPGRRSQDETKELAKSFEGRLICPEWKDPHGRLVDEQVLARVERAEVEGDRVRLSADERQQFELWQDIPEKTLNRLGESNGRNQRLLAELDKVPSGCPTLIFACSMDHARLLTLALRAKGRRAAFVSGETPKALRRRYVAEFRQGEIECLVNCEVLTTGFDAPKVEVVVLAHPTMSAIKYEQMVGRGLRGPKNGGTDLCQVIDVVDNMDVHGATMSYARYRDEWKRPAVGFERMGPAAPEDQVVP